MTQDAGGALALSRKASRDDFSDFSAFDAALAQSADDAQADAGAALGAAADPTAPSTADASGKATLTTAGGDVAPSSSARSQFAWTPRTWTPAGDRLASRMAAARLDATTSDPATASSTLASAGVDHGRRANALHRQRDRRLLSPRQTPSSPQRRAGGQDEAAPALQTTQSTLPPAALTAQAGSAAPATAASAKTSPVTSRQDPVSTIDARTSQAAAAPAAEPVAASARRTARAADARDSDAGLDAPAATNSPDPVQSSAAAATPTPFRPLIRPIAAVPAVFRAAAARGANRTGARLTVRRHVGAVSPARRRRHRRRCLIPWPASAPPCRVPRRAGRPKPRRAPEPEAGTTSVHVVSQQSWLPPVDPNFSGGAQSHQSPGKDSGSAPDEKAQTVQGGEPVPSFAQAASVNFAAASLPTSAPVSSAAQASASAASTQLRQDMPSAPTPAVRRDLEITLAPQELGGLQVRLKSSGDRLELSFVADRGETARMISDRSAALESQLHHAGIGLGGVAISASAAGGMSGDAQSNAAQGGQGSQAQSAPTSGSSSGAAGGQGESKSTRQRQNSSGRQPQDAANEPSDVSREPRGSVGDRGLYL